MTRGTEIAGDIELFARELPPDQKVLAITGTNGKTTVTALTGALSRAAGLQTVVAGNIGDAVLDALATQTADAPWPRVFVLELSSFQLETTSSLVPIAAAVLNVTANHLDRYAGIDDYAAAKARIFAQATVQILNRDDPRSFGDAAARPRPCRLRRRACRNRKRSGVWSSAAATTWLARGGALLMPTSRARRSSAATTR